jgi:hypothetical protein
MNHNKVVENGALFLALTREPMWLQNVHGGNLSNRTKQRLPRFAAPARMLVQFGMRANGPEHLRRAAQRAQAGALRSLRRHGRNLLRAFGLRTGRNG